MIIAFVMLCKFGFLQMENGAGGVETGGGIGNANNRT